MAQLTDLYLKLDTLKTLVSTLEAKGEKGIALTIAINDEANNYGQNVSATISQSKEEREAKKQKFYVGNGKTFWANDNSFIPPKHERDATSGQSDTDVLPF